MAPKTPVKGEKPLDPRFVQEQKAWNWDRSSEAEQRTFNPKRGISKFPGPTKEMQCMLRTYTRVMQLAPLTTIHAMVAPVAFRRQEKTAGTTIHAGSRRRGNGIVTQCGRVPGFYPGGCRFEAVPVPLV